MSWTEQPIFFVDFEGSRASGVLEYGSRWSWRRCGGRKNRLCRPIGQVPAEDTAVHGLRAEGLEGFAPFADDWNISPICGNAARWRLTTLGWKMRC